MEDISNLRFLVIDTRCFSPVDVHHCETYLHCLKECLRSLANLLYASPGGRGTILSIMMVTAAKVEVLIQTR